MTTFSDKFRLVKLTVYFFPSMANQRLDLCYKKRKKMTFFPSSTIVYNYWKNRRRLYSVSKINSLILRRHRSLIKNDLFN